MNNWADCTWTPNDARGCSYFFSSGSIDSFLQDNSLTCLIRAHEAQPEGYKMHQNNPRTGFPAVLTIFSAPNYCDTLNNKAAVLKIEEDASLRIVQFNHTAHPYHL